MNSKKKFLNTNKFIVKLVAMMKVRPILSRNFLQLLIGVKTDKNYWFITF